MPLFTRTDRGGFYKYSGRQDTLGRLYPLMVMFHVPEATLSFTVSEGR